MNRLVHTSDLDYHRDTIRSDSYVTSDVDKKIGICKLMGRRPQQEDFEVTGTINLTDDLTHEQWKRVLEVTVFLSQENLPKDDRSRFQGSCLVAVILVGNRAYIANVGDSYVFSVVAGDEVTSAKYLNGNLHHISNKEEAKRVKDEGGIIDRRIDGFLGLNKSLSVTRAMGDSNHDGTFDSDDEYDEGYNPHRGLSHIPDIYHNIIDIPHGHKGFVFLSSDGVFDNKNATLEAIASLVLESKNMPIQNIAYNVADQAYNTPSTDNITVVTIDIDTTKRSPIFAAVFDGHGGTYVARFLEDNFPLLLERAVREVLES